MIVAATGHRPDKLGGYSAAIDDRLRALASGFFQERKPAGVVVGMALGWDMACAEAALALGIPICAAVPFVGQESRWPAASRWRYYDLISKAAKVVTVCEGGFAAWKMQKRNEWMVNKATFVVALWDGTTGGTSNCVRYAEAVGKPIENLWPRWSS